MPRNSKRKAKDKTEMLSELQIFEEGLYESIPSQAEKLDFDSRLSKIKNEEKIMLTKLDDTEDHEAREEIIQNFSAFLKIQIIETYNILHDLQADSSEAMEYIKSGIMHYSKSGPDILRQNLLSKFFISDIASIKEEQFHRFNTAVISLDAKYKQALSAEYLIKSFNLDRLPSPPPEITALLLGETVSPALSGCSASDESTMSEADMPAVEKPSLIDDSSLKPSSSEDKISDSIYPYPDDSFTLTDIIRLEKSRPSLEDDTFATEDKYAAFCDPSIEDDITTGITGIEFQHEDIPEYDTPTSPTESSYSWAGFFSEPTPKVHLFVDLDLDGGVDPDLETNGDFYLKM